MSLPTTEQHNTAVFTGLRKCCFYCFSSMPEKCKGFYIDHNWKTQPCQEGN